MKFMHLADLHIGKRVNGFSMLEEQIDILDKIVEIIREEKIDALLIAGDIYDKSVPAGEAVGVFDDFLVRVFRENVDVYIISGNHDSAERLSFGSRIMDACNIHIAPVYQNDIQPWTLHDEHGDVDIWMIPFIRPTDVRRYWPDAAIETYTDAMRVVIDHLEIHKDRKNIAIVHQFITNSERCDSEDQSIGGLDNIDCDVFAPFDYVALGHLHGPQHVTRDTIRYAGSPLKYSFSEMRHKKSATIVSIDENVQIRTVPLVPMREWEELTGSFLELISPDFRTQHSRENYYRIVLTDKDRIHGAADILREYYPLCMSVEYAVEKEKFMHDAKAPEIDKKPIDYFAELFEKSHGRAMEPEEKNIVESLIEKIWTDDES